MIPKSKTGDIALFNFDLCPLDVCCTWGAKRPDPEQYLVEDFCFGFTLPLTVHTTGPPAELLVQDVPKGSFSCPRKPPPKALAYLVTRLHSHCMHRLTCFGYALNKFIHRWVRDGVSETCAIGITGLGKSSHVRSCWQPVSTLGKPCHRGWSSQPYEEYGASKSSLSSSTPLHKCHLKHRQAGTSVNKNMFHDCT